jgi:DNA-binding transcriptional LysR family regulator
MSSAVELREIRAFLTLAEELHFGRTAERLELTPSRVSQTIRTLETRVGGRLFERTSRRVRLTPAGEQLRLAIDSSYQQLEQAIATTQETVTGVSGTLRLGMYSTCNGGPHLIEIAKTFEARHPACRVVVTDTGWAREQVDWLVHGELDVLAMRLPLNDTRVTIGPILSNEPRVLAVAIDHPLAGRDTICIEDIADYVVTDIPTAPRDDRRVHPIPHPVRKAAASQRGPHSRRDTGPRGARRDRPSHGALLP